MNGPQHYREAERLLHCASHGSTGGLNVDNTIRLAQVHATLAQVAATVQPVVAAWVGDVPDARAWAEVTS